MPDSRLIPVPPSSHRLPVGDATFFHEQLADLDLRIEWLTQAVDGVRGDASSGAFIQLGHWARAMHDLHTAVARVQSHLENPSVAKAFALDLPLAAFLSRLFAWSEEIIGDFEGIAARLRRAEPVLGVFSHRAVSESFAHFQDLIAAMRAALAAIKSTDPESQPAWRALETDLEELLWSTEWLHVGLARAPGSAGHYSFAFEA
jgi:hypothetical protein